VTRPALEPAEAAQRPRAANHPLEQLRSPRRWLVIGLAMLVFGVIPLLSGGVRIVVCAVGLVMVLIAVGLINARRSASGTPYDPPPPPARWGSPGGGF
jgi:hypothetical protein